MVTPLLFTPIRRLVAFGILAALVGVEAGCASSEASNRADGDDTSVGESAVVTRRCPPTLVAKLMAPSPYTAEEIELLERAPLREDERIEFGKQTARLARVARYEIELGLRKAEKFECAYEANSPISGPKSSATFYTKDGRNILRIDARDGAVADFSFTVNIDSYAKSGWGLEDDASAVVEHRPTDSDGGVRSLVLGRMQSIALTPEL